MTASGSRPGIGGSGAIESGAAPWTTWESDQTVCAKIVVAGIRWREARKRQVLFVARLNRDGSLDRSFGPRRRGWVTFRRESHGWDVNVQSNGLAVVVGSAPMYPLPYSQSFVLRLRPNGRRDRRYGGGDGVAEVRALRGDFYELVERRGSVVVGGRTPRGRKSITLVRLTPRGRLDRRFGRSGRVVKRVGTRSSVGALAFYGPNKLLVGGQSVRNRAPHFLVGRIHNPLSR